MAGKNSGLRLTEKNSRSSKKSGDRLDSARTQPQDSQNKSSRSAILNKLLSSDELFKCKRDILPWKQRYRWDCGIACVAMCLPDQTRPDLYDNLDVLKKHFGFNNATWTIDLCFLLEHHHVGFRFVTNYAGMDPLLKQHSFYKKSFERDRSRVLKAFADAEEKNMAISIRNLFVEEIFEHIFLHGPVIVLVNYNLLQCIDCSSKLNCVTCCFRTRFHGHYILAIGFDLKNDWVYYNDPVYGDRTCKVTVQDFDIVRMAPGTDGDAILVNCCTSFDRDGDVGRKANETV